MDYLLKNTLVVTSGEDCKLLQNTDILIQNGKISRIDKNIKIHDKDFCRQIDLKGKMVLPGFINGHSHSYATIVRGMGDLLPLEPWLYYAMLVGLFSADEIRIASLLQVIECIKNGCTAFVDHLSREYQILDKTMEAYANTGIRAYIATMVGDKSYDQELPFTNKDLTPEDLKEFQSNSPQKNYQEFLEETEELIIKWNKYQDTLGVIVGVARPLKCSDELMVNSMRLAEKYNVGFHTHLLETRIQAQNSQRQYGKTLVSHLGELGLLSPRCSFAHGVWLTDEDISLIAKSGSTIVHNPISNLTLGSGIAPILKYLEKGAFVALGTDGSNCGGSQSLFLSMHLASVLPRVSTPFYKKWPSAYDALRMATTGGSKVLLAEERVGSISPGKVADLVVINLERTTYQPLHDPIQQMVYGEKGDGIEMVMVNGKILLEDGKLTTIDEKSVLCEARKMATLIQSKKDSWIEKNRRQFNLVEKIYNKQWSL